jgi:hypothetical protein
MKEASWAGVTMVKVSQRTRRVVASVAALGLLVGLGLELARLLLPFAGANLLRGDGAGQVFLTWFTGLELLPWGTGWCPLLWGGFPVGYHYPPLFHIVGAALAIPLGLLPSLKLLTVLALLASLALFWKLGPQGPLVPLWSRVLLLWVVLGFLLLPSGLLGFESAPGVNLESVLGNGMLPSGAGLALMLGFLWALEQRRPLATPLLLALVMSTHLVWGLLAVLVFGLDLLITLARAGRTGQGPSEPRASASGLESGLSEPRAPASGLLWGPWRLLATYLLQGLLALALCAWWLLPFLAHLGRLGGTSIGVQAPLPLLALPLLSLLLVDLGDRRRLLWGELVLASLLPLALASAGLLKLHAYRFVIPALLGAIPLIWGVLGRSRLPLQPLLGGLFILAALLSPLRTAGNPGLPPFFDLPPVEGAVLPLEDPLHTPGYLALPHALARQGLRVSHGISVESAPSAPAWMHLFGVLQPGAYTWGVDLLCPSCPAPDGAATIGMMRALGLGGVLTDRRLEGLLPPDTLRDYHRALDFPRWTAADDRFDLSQDGQAFAFGLTRLNTGADALLLPGLVARGGDGRAWTPGLWGQWFARGAAGAWPAGLAQVPKAESAIPARALPVRELSGGRGTLLEVELPPAQGSPRAVAVLRSAHPWWEARTLAGQDLETFPCGPAWTCVQTPGSFQLGWREGWPAPLGRGISSLALLGLCLAALRLLKGRRRRAKTAA